MYAGKDPYFIHSLPDQLRRHRADGAHRGRRHAHGDLLAGPAVLRRHLVAGRSAAAVGAQAHERSTGRAGAREGRLTALLATGWRMPEPFMSKGRDGTTEIWGVIIRPTNFDPSRKYPVIENIYAGPQGSFVPKTFSTQTGMNAARRARASSSCRSTAWAPRIARRRSTTWRGRTSAMPASRIGSSGTRRSRRSTRTTTSRASASTARRRAARTRPARVLFHPEFYKVAVFELRLPRQPDGQDLVERAVDGMADRPALRRVVQRRQRAQAQGPLMLLVPEMDTNVDPASTMQVVNALIQANKTFELVVVPGANHGAGGAVQHAQAQRLVRQAPARARAAELERDHGHDAGRRRRR